VRPKDGRVARLTYGRDGRVAGAEVTGVRVAIERDAAGRIVREQQGEYWVETVYDAAGERVQLRSSLGARFVYLRDALGQVTTAWVGEPRLNEWRVDLAHDRAGREAQRAFPGGVVATWERDAAGRPMKHTVLAGGKRFCERAYAWDAMGCPTSIVDTRFGAMALDYDASGRLKGWTERGARVARGLDAVGDVFRTRDGSDADYAAGGRIVRSGDVRYLHDARGCMVSAKVGDAPATVFEWTTTGLLASVALADGRTVRYEYDAFGRRVRKTVGTDVTAYVWDGNVLLHEVSSGEGVTTWMWLPGTFSLLGEIRGGRYLAVVTDQVDAPLALVGADGVAAWSGLITPWGEALTEGPAPRCAWRFAGHYQDPETQLLASRHRHYAPLLGRYIDPHPLGLHGGTNPYRYVDDPVWQSDPSGLLTRMPRGVDEAALQRLDPRAQMLIDRVGGDIARDVLPVDEVDVRELVNQWLPPAGGRAPLDAAGDAAGPAMQGWQAPLSGLPRVRVR
jgi:RHS repeat-associated protein